LEALNVSCNRDLVVSSPSGAQLDGSSERGRH
jgi:hypothetical protein